MSVSDAPDRLATDSGAGDGVSSPATTTSMDRPTRRDEAWRYAPHAILGRLTFGPSRPHSRAVPAEVVAQIPELDGPTIVLVNGVVDDTLSNLADLPDGVTFSALAAGDAPERRSDETVSNAFLALNREFATDGAVIRIEAGRLIETPLHIVDVVLPDEVPNAACHRVVIDLGAGASATVVETCIGGGAHFGGTNARTTIDLGADSTLEHVIVQDAPSTMVHLSRFDVRQAARSRFRSRSFNLGALYGRIAFEVHLGGEGAVADMSGLYFGLGDQTLDQQITIVHDAKDCTSRQLFRGVLDDESTGVFNGGIDVRPGADGTDAEQSNDNLLLSRRAEVNTQPRLEILADDVACKHGATVGQLDDTALYYMRTRGIASEEAHRLLVAGFVAQVVDGVDIETLRTWIRTRTGLAENG